MSLGHLCTQSKQVSCSLEWTFKERDLPLGAIGEPHRSIENPEKLLREQFSGSCGFHATAFVHRLRHFE